MSDLKDLLADDKRDLWEISFLDDFIHEKNEDQIFYLRARIVLQKLQSNITKTLPSNIDQALNKIIGSVCDSEGNIISNNFNKNTEKIIFKVDKSDLNRTSEKLYHHSGFRMNEVEIQNFIDEILTPNKLYKKLHYAPVHKLKSNNTDNGIDFFILPSYEVMRYFFLKGSKLNKFLFKKFLLAKKIFDNNNNELYVKLDTNEEEKGNYLLTKQGLSDSEYSTVCRMAYIKNGFKCVEEIRKSLLINNQKFEYEYKTLKTILPQDEPFEMLCTGRRFQFRNKNYFLINQIHGVKENLPTKDITLLFFTDRRRNKNIQDGVNGGDNGGKGSKGKKKRTQKKTKAEDNAELTSELLGNGDIAADVQLDYFNDNSFQGDSFNFTKLEKINGEYKHNGTLTINLPKSVLSVMSEIDKNSDAGRANTHSNPVNDSKNNEFRKMRRDVFYEAINNLKTETCKVNFFQFNDEGKPLLSNSRTIVEPHKTDSSYETIICQICIEKNHETFYLYMAKSDSHQDEISRYAIFNNYSFQKFDLLKLAGMYNEIFSKEGLRFKAEDLNSNNYNLRNSLGFHNQSDYNQKMLKDKMEREIENKIKKFN